jgi:hypothetical protein
LKMPPRSKSGERFQLRRFDGPRAVASKLGTKPGNKCHCAAARDNSGKSAGS